MMRADLWLFTTLFCAGTIAGMIAVWPASKPVPADKSTPAPAVVDSHTTNTNGTSDRTSRIFNDPSAVAELRRDSSGNDILWLAHDYLMNGSYDRAARLLRAEVDSVSLRNPGTHAPAFVWLGLAEELTGRKKAAELAYSTSLRGPTVELYQAFALTGLARIWIEDGRADQALDLLADLYLQSSGSGAGRTWLKQELLWLIPLALRDLGLQTGVSGVSSSAAAVEVHFLEPALDVEQTLVALASALESETPDRGDDGHTDEEEHGHSSTDLHSGEPSSHQPDPHGADNHAGEDSAHPAAETVPPDTQPHHEPEQGAGPAHADQSVHAAGFFVQEPSHADPVHDDHHDHGTGSAGSHSAPTQSAEDHPPGDAASTAGETLPGDPSMGGHSAQHEPQEGSSVAPPQPAVEDSHENPSAHAPGEEGSQASVSPSLPRRSPAGFVLKARPSDDLATIVLDAELEVQPLVRILQQLAAVSGLTLEITADARQELTARNQTLDVEGVDGAELMDVLLATMPLTWYQDGAFLTISFTGEEGPGRKYNETAARMFRRFVVQGPDDYRVGYAWLNIGNLALLREDLDTAAAAYQAAMESAPTGELLARLLLNHASVDRRLGRLDSAMDRLFRVIDVSLDLNVQGNTWVEIAGLSLQLGQFGEAVRTANRALRGNTSPDAKSRAAVHLATAYLMLGNPYPANEIIFGMRDELKVSREARTARFLGSYGRYEGSQSESAREREIPRLLSALSDLTNDGPTDPAVTWLVAKAWHRLGFEDRAAQSIAVALAASPGDFWISRLGWELALIQLREGDREAAIGTLEQLARIQRGELVRQAKLEIARQHLAAGRPQLALDAARPVVTDDDALESEKKDALQVLGSAYMAAGQPHSAALCFSGMLPEAINAALPDPDQDSTSLPESKQ